jgi:phenylacetate-CoA ligase
MSEKKYWDEKIETLPRAELEELQRRKLKEMLTFAYNNSTYYKESFDLAGLTPADFNQLDDIQKFPFTNKATQRERQAKGGFCIRFQRINRGADAQPLYQTGF